MQGACSYNTADIYYSDDDNDVPSTSGAITKVHTETADYDPYTE